MAVDHLTALDLVIGQGSHAATPKPVTNPERGDGLLSLDEAAQHLSATGEQVMGFVQDGELRYINVGRGKKRGMWE